MKKIPLAEYLKQPGRSQEALAEAVNLNQSAISKMLRVKRNISVITHEDGSIELLEEKVIRPPLQKLA